MEVLNKVHPEAGVRGAHVPRPVSNRVAELSDDVRPPRSLRRVVKALFIASTLSSSQFIHLRVAAAGTSLQGVCDCCARRQSFLASNVFEDGDNDPFPKVIKVAAKCGDLRSGRAVRVSEGKAREGERARGRGGERGP